VVEHNMAYDGPKRLWYKGPMFRHERPQRGRYRQFFQFGAEAIGFAGPDIDAELIMLCRRLWDDLGLDNIRLELNSIGNAEERQRHRADLIAYFEANIDVLDAEAKRRLHANPLRILDTKNPAMQELVNGAPKLLDYLGGESLAHFEGLKTILDASNVQYTVNPRLVRGLDYYNRTVFEWVTDELGAQGTVCAGGRYDPLIETFGGKPTPGIGFAMGIERLIELMKGQGEPAAPSQCDVYMVHQGEEAQLKAFILAERIRDAGLDVVLHCATPQGAGSFKSQMKKADASGAAFAVIIGEDEVRNEVVAVKSLREAEAGAQQTSVPFDEAVDFIVDQVIGGHDHDHDHDHVHYHP
jgi:histidyl-tRNA synthetase